MKKQICLWAMLLAACLLFSGCELTRDMSITDISWPWDEAEQEWITPSPAPTLNNEPARLLTGVTTGGLVGKAQKTDEAPKGDSALET